MRTTIDIPTPLLRRVKAEAALEGISMKEFVSRALDAALRRGPEPSSPPLEEAGQQDVGDGCVFPLLHGAGPLLGGLTGDNVSRLLDEEDVDRALATRRR